MLDKEEEGISLGDVFRWIFKGKLVGLISGAVVLLLLLTAMLAVINPQDLVYQVEFDYSSIPGIGSGNGYYIDGTRFSYLDIITEDNVNQVIEDNKEALKSGAADYDYSTIKLTDLFEGNKFTIDINRVYYDALVEGETPELKSTHYLVTMPQSAFKNAAIARDFAKALINVPIDNTRTMIKNLNFNTNLEMYNQASSFTTKLAYLTNQVNLLQEGYSSFSNATNGTQYIINGTTYNFDSIVARINDFLDSQNYSIMADEIRQVGYVNDKTVAKKNYDTEMDDLVKEHAYLTKQLETANQTYNDAKTALSSIDGNSTLLTTEQILALLTQLNTTLLNDITSLNNQILANEESQRVLQIKIDALDSLSAEDNAAFKARLDAIEARLVTETETYDLVYKEITGRNMGVYYVDSNIIREDGDMGAIMKYGIPVAAGIVVAICVAWAYGYAKCKKEEKEVETATVVATEAKTTE